MSDRESAERIGRIEEQWHNRKLVNAEDIPWMLSELRRLREENWRLRGDLAAALEPEQEHAD